MISGVRLQPHQRFRLLTIVYLPLPSFLRITVIWSPLSDRMTCMLRRMEATVAIDLKLGDLDLTSNHQFAPGGVIVYFSLAAAPGKHMAQLRPPVGWSTPLHASHHRRHPKLSCRGQDCRQLHYSRLSSHLPFRARFPSMPTRGTRLPKYPPSMYGSSILPPSLQLRLAFILVLSLGGPA
jgi:hypothetical protein